MTFRKTKFTLSALAMSAALATTTPAKAMDASCTLAEKLFVCAHGKTGAAAIFAALANPDTAKNLKDAGPGYKVFGSNMERELYRRSVEKARRSAKAHADSAFRQYKRRRMSAQDYEAVRAEFKAAMANYNAALGLFHSRDWFSPTKDKNAEGDD